MSVSHISPIDDFRETFIDGLKNRTLTSCYRWATKRRMIQSISTPAIEPYSARLHPWVVAMHDSTAQFNYAMKGAQLGVTEVVINSTFYEIDKCKRDVLYVLPTSGTASDFSKARFGGALACSKYLKSLFTDTNAVNIKQAGANTLYIRGSRGESSLISIPVSVLILDEVDRMEQGQVWLALERLSGKLEKRVWGISTPTLPNYGIHKLFLGSTQEHFVFKCPGCSRWTQLVWPDCVEIVGDHPTDLRCHESYLKCKECGCRLEQADKPNFLKDAVWQAFDNSANPDVRGFHINQLYSFTVTAGDLVVSYLRGFGDELAEKEFNNSKLGKPFIAAGAKVDGTMVEKAFEHVSYSKNDDRPKYGGRLITMGVDRGKWNYATICEWFQDRDQSFDVNNAHMCKVLYEFKFLDEDFDNVVDQLMLEWQVLGCVVDADPGVMEARKFARRFPGHVWLCRYRTGKVAREIVVSDEDDGAPMATVDRSNWLSTSLGRFKTTPTRIMLPWDVSTDFKNHIQALTSTYVRDDDGEPMLDFVKTGDADHFAHSLNYAEIALPLCAGGGGNRDITK